MRASRLLQILLLLQNRGRLSCAALARELEVTSRTVLRDVDALSEAGLPIVVIRGNQGGIELGFNYRTRLTGFSTDEIEALAVVLSQSKVALHELGMGHSATRAIGKLVESFTDPVRKQMNAAFNRFKFDDHRMVSSDERLKAIAAAIRGRHVVQINCNCKDQRLIHPIALQLGKKGWKVTDNQHPKLLIAIAACGDISISAQTF